MNASFLSLPLLLACDLQATSEPAVSVRVATFNVNCRNQHVEQVSDAIKEAHADVIFLQETTIESERYLRSKLRSTYPYFCATGYEGRFAEERLAFLSQFPLREVVFSPPSGGYFGFLSANCEFGRTAVRLINVHLAPFVMRRQYGITGFMAAMDNVERRHTAEIDAISKKLDSRQPTIVAGDFNSVSTFVAPRRLRKIGFVDSFAATHSDADSHPTWHGTVASMALQFRLDYIFHSRHFSCVESKVIERGGSDHFLVVSELRILTPEDAANRNQPVRSKTKRTSSAAAFHR